LCVSMKSEFLALLFQSTLFLAYINVHTRVISFFVTDNIMVHEPLHNIHFNKVIINLIYLENIIMSRTNLNLFRFPHKRIME
jgi:hypothetical protein